MKDNLLIADQGQQRIIRLNTNGTVSKIAGGGSTIPRDGVVATNAGFTGPYGVAVDCSNNVYVASTGIVFKVSTNGIISMVAGRFGIGGNSGDGGQSTNALLYSTFDLLFDSFGNLFIADGGRIRMVGTDGIISTVAGGGTNTDGVNATNAALVSPRGIAIDAAGNLFIAETGGHRIRKVDVSSNIISTLAGTGVLGTGNDGGFATNTPLYTPSGVAVDTFGNVYIADPNDARVRRVDTNGVITTVAGKIGAISGDGGPATNAYIGPVTGLAVDAGNNLLLMANDGIRVVSSSTYSNLLLYNIKPPNSGDYTVVVTNMYGAVTSSVAPLDILCAPSITEQPTNCFVASGSDVIFALTATGARPLTYSWYCSPTSLLQSGTNRALSLHNVDSNKAGNYFAIITNFYGSITSAMTSLSVFSQIQPSTNAVSIGGNASFNVAALGTGPFHYQWRLNGTNLPNNVLSTVAGNGTYGFSGDGGNATNASLALDLNPLPTIAFDSKGNLYIADTDNQRVRKVDTTGIITTVAGNGTCGYSGDGGPATNAALYWPESIALDSQGGLYISGFNNSGLRFVDTNGTITTITGGGTNGDGNIATNANLSITVDQNDNLYIGEVYACYVRKVDGNGVMTTIAGNGRPGHSGDGGPATNACLGGPTSLTFDTAGSLYITEGSGYVRKIDTNGVIYTMAGSGNEGYSGDGGLATAASFYGAVSSTVDKWGNVFIADQLNFCIRKVDTNGIIDTIIPKNYVAGPAGLTMNSSGDLVICERFGNRVRKVSYLECADQPQLVLSNVVSNNLGHYDVVVSNPYGTLTSSIATLTITLPPTILALMTINGQIKFLWSANSNGFYQLQYCTDLISGIWLNLGGPIITTNIIGQASDFVRSDKQRFYRVQLQ
jgi:sugar lactone lactonase YvrE